MTFIRTIPPSEAEGPVREMYDQAQKEYGLVTNWVQAFSIRPAVRYGWASLISSIRANVPLRRYALATLAAARALRSSYCSLAHARILLANDVLDAPAITTIMHGDASAVLEPREVAMMQFVEKVVLTPYQITDSDIAVLRSHGYSDEEIFDIAATGAARCFLSKLMDALGVEPDARYWELDPDLREALTVGRPLATDAAGAGSRDVAR
jgi:uncharacterized peroxidase-related enzyme